MATNPTLTVDQLLARIIADAQAVRDQLANPITAGPLPNPPATTSPVKGRGG